MNLKTDANIIGSTLTAPMVVVESKTQAEKYIVPITATIEMTLNGEV